MALTTKQKILDCAKDLFARDGYEGLSMRMLAKESGVGLSSIYHFFEDKDTLLKELFRQVSEGLKADCESLPLRESAKEMLRDRIEFHFKNIESVVCILRYYMHFRPQVLQLDSEFVPTSSYIHMDDVVRRGIETGEFASDAIERDAKLITHMLNGFLLEYYPDKPEGNDISPVVDALTGFITRALSPQSR